MSHVLQEHSRGSVQTGCAPAKAPVRAAWWRLRSGWPFTATFVAFPLWWILGISSFVGIIAAIFMGCELASKKRLVVARGYGLWALFLVWVTVGVFVLQVDAPAAVPGGSNGRYITWAYRLGWYISATIALLYVANSRGEQLSTRRINRTFAVMFLVVAAGGWLGVLLPRLDFPSLLELCLPSSIRRIEFIRFLVHPQLTQLYDGAVTRTPRPSAPFAFTNIWGLNFACFLPFFLIAWWGKDAGWRRPIAPVVLTVAVYPAIQSLNRGLWASLLVCAVFVAVKSTMTGNVKVLAGLAASSLILGGILVLSPLSAMIQTRLDNPTSNEGRTNLGAQTVESVIRGSPIVGFGTTRNVQGNFRSIAAGDSAICDRCTPPALGTQGHLWLVVFSQGVLGLLLYLGFFAVQFLRHCRLRSPQVTASLCVLLTHAVTLPIYDTIGIATFPILVAVALMWRERDESTLQYGQSGGTGSLGIPLGTYVGMFRRQWLIVGACILLGGLIGGLWREANGVTASATVSILLPEEPAYLTNDSRGTTLDTEAQLAIDSPVLAAIGGAVGHSVSPDNVAITADPNTRILNLRYTGVGIQSVNRGATAAASAVIALRAKELTAQQTRAITSLRVRSDSLTRALNTIDASRDFLSIHLGSSGGAEIPALHDQQAKALAKAGLAGARIARAMSVPLEAGTIVRPADARESKSSWLVPSLSGTMLGLLVGLLCGMLRDAMGGALGAGGKVSRRTGVPVVAYLTKGDVPRHGGCMPGDARVAPNGRWNDAVLAVMLENPAACISVTDELPLCEAARTLERCAGQSVRPDVVEEGPTRRRRLERGDLCSHQVVLVASTRTPVRLVAHATTNLAHLGGKAVGLVLIS